MFENNGGFGKNANLIWRVLKMRLSFLILRPMPMLESAKPWLSISFVPDSTAKSAKPKKANLKP
jgi:hypothetical protein